MTAGTPKTQKKLVWGGYHNLSDLPGPICDFSRFFREFQPRTQILKKPSSWTSESEKNVWKWIFSNSVPKFQKYDTWAPFWYIYIGHAPSRSKITIFWNPIVHFSGLIGLSLFWKPLIFSLKRKVGFDPQKRTQWFIEKKASISLISVSAKNERQSSFPRRSTWTVARWNSHDGTKHVTKQLTLTVPSEKDNFWYFEQTICLYHIQRCGIMAASGLHRFGVSLGRTRREEAGYAAKEGHPY